MLWPILCVACGSLGGVAVSMPLWQVVSICCCAIALNVALLACALSKRWGALHVLTWVHVASYFALWALQFQMNLWVITRLLVGLHSCWVRSCAFCVALLCACMRIVQCCSANDATSSSRHGVRTSLPTT